MNKDHENGPQTLLLHSWVFYFAWTLFSTSLGLILCSSLGNLGCGCNSYMIKLNLDSHSQTNICDTLANLFFSCESCDDAPSHRKPILDRSHQTSDWTHLFISHTHTLGVKSCSGYFVCNMINHCNCLLVSLVLTLA